MAKGAFTNDVNQEGGGCQKLTEVDKGGGVLEKFAMVEVLMKTRNIIIYVQQHLTIECLLI